jgi:hypothetical protein
LDRNLSWSFEWGILPIGFVCFQWWQLLTATSFVVIPINQVGTVRHGRANNVLLAPLQSSANLVRLQKEFEQLESKFWNDLVYKDTYRITKDDDDASTMDTIPAQDFAEHTLEKAIDMALCTKDPTVKLTQAGSLECAGVDERYRRVNPPSTGTRIKPPTCLSTSIHISFMQVPTIA